MSKIDFTELCKREQRIGPAFREEAKAVTRYLNGKGFDDLEYLGSGTFAIVVAPKNNKEFCLRIFPGDSGPRNPMPYMLQSIGKWDTDIPVGVMGMPIKIEVLKRMDMQVAKNELDQFLAEIKKHGSRGASLGRGAEIGHYNFTDNSGASRKVRMASDPSAIDAPQVDDWGECTREAHHPTLVDQMRENLRIAQADSRISEFVPELEQRMQCYAQGDVQIYLSPHERAWEERLASECEARLRARYEGKKDHALIKRHESGGRTH